MTPIRGARAARGPDTCPIARVASGTPPNGNDNRSTSASEWQTTNADLWELSLVEILAAMKLAMPCITQKISTATMYPGADRNHIHANDGKNHAAAKRKPLEKECSLRRTATEPYIAIPTKPSGHQPHGGIDAATKRPANTGRNERRLMSFTNEAWQGEQVLLRLLYVPVAHMQEFRYLCN